MIFKTALIILAGVALGGIMGYLGKCSNGQCPLTSTPIRGAIWGGIIAVLAVVLMVKGS